MQEMRIFTIVVPGDFDLDLIHKVLPNGAAYHLAVVAHDFLHSRFFWERCAYQLTKDLFNRYTE